jgi:hypothetical protein
LVVVVDFVVSEKDNGFFSFKQVKVPKLADQFTPEEVRKLKALIGSKSKPRTTHVIQVLDESSSMSTGKDVTVSSYNEMQDIAKKSVAGTEDSITFTLVKFSDFASISSVRVPADNAIGLNNENYRPHGMTALFDAIGLAITTARSYPQDSETAFLLQIFTDGDENASTQYTAQQLKSLIAELNSTGRWTVTVAGPRGNIDIFTKGLGIAKGNTTTFDPTSYQSRVSNAGMMLNSTANYFAARSVGTTAVYDSYSSIAADEATQTGISNVNQGTDPTCAVGNSVDLSNTSNIQTQNAAKAWPFPTGNRPDDTTNKAS